MEFRQLRYFLAVADELHFGRAAQRLHMSQPPLSVQISRLEQELGSPLFERSTRRVSLTPAGRHLQDRARSILDDVDALVDEVGEFATGFAGALTAGFVSSANYTVLPELVQLFRAHRVHVSLQLVPLTSGEQFDRLREGTLDVGIVRDEGPRDAASGPAVVVEPVFEERLVACLPASHPLADRAEVTAAELIEVPLIAYPRSLMPGYVDRVRAVLAPAGAPNVVEEVVHQETALAFVAARAGATILPESVRHMAPRSVAIVPLAGSPTSHLLVARPARSTQPALSDAFVTAMHEAAARLSRTSDGEAERPSREAAGTLRA